MYTPTTMEKVLSCKELLEAAELLLQFSEMAMSSKERNKIVKYAKAQLSDIQRTFSFALWTKFLLSNWNSEEKEQKKKREIFIFSDEEAVQHHLAHYVDRDLPPVKFLRALEAYSRDVKNHFTPSSGSIVGREFIEEVMEYLEVNYNFIDKIYRNTTPIFIRLNNSHIQLNGITGLTDSSNENGHQVIFLYNLKKYSTATPEFVLLHELGHVVQNRYGTPSSPPQSFHNLANALDIKWKDTYELCEIFADAFAVSMLYKSDYEKYDSYLGMPDEVKQVYKKYFETLLSQEKTDSRKVYKFKGKFRSEGQGRI